ncbi:hypothetical protein [Allorhizocola rhizosphaerae]|uniref:hypothetical protein n=1 Tax=Allorhizocola rhizosphaerae TaxID=1872709 RepID=UPI000E3B98BC|nr:hypothetical protein [Allorhizocola rhizosphaerae]
MKRKVITIALLFAVTGCGGEQGNNNGVASVGGSTSPHPVASSALSQQEKALKWVQCMREKGVEVPDPDPATGRVQMRFGPGTDQAKVQAAMQACKEFQPFGEGGQGGNPQQQEAQRKFAQCMRDNGVASFPDPQDGAIRIDPSLASDPDFPAAREKCQSLLQAGTR